MEMFWRNVCLEFIKFQERALQSLILWNTQKLINFKFCFKTLKCLFPTKSPKFSKHLSRPAFHQSYVQKNSFYSAFDEW